jgi:hypothetical protein
MEELELFSESLAPKISTETVYRQIVINLTSQYAYHHTHYQLSEEGMADKIIEIANKICSKI